MYTSTKFALHYSIPHTFAKLGLFCYHTLGQKYKSFYLHLTKKNREAYYYRLVFLIIFLLFVFRLKLSYARKRKKAGCVQPPGSRSWRSYCTIWKHVLKRKKRGATLWSRRRKNCNSISRYGFCPCSITFNVILLYPGGFSLDIIFCIWHQNYLLISWSLLDRTGAVFHGAK